jgi:hypothetical protein
MKMWHLEMREINIQSVHSLAHIPSHVCVIVPLRIRTLMRLVKQMVIGTRMSYARSKLEVNNIP